MLSPGIMKTNPQGGDIHVICSLGAFGSCVSSAANKTFIKKDYIS